MKLQYQPAEFLSSLSFLSNIAISLLTLPLAHKKLVSDGDILAVSHKRKLSKKEPFTEDDSI